MSLDGIDFARVQVVTFDVGGTLLAPYPSVGEVYAEVLAVNGVKIDPVIIEQRFRTAFKEQVSLRPRPKVSEATEKIFWSEIAHRSVTPECPEGIFEKIFQNLWNEFASAKRWRVRTGANETIAGLAGKKKPRLAVLSNWDSRLRQVIKELGWSSSFEQIFISSELGAEKPDHRAFHSTQQALGVPSDACLHVGDSYAQDYQGARNAGWQAVLLSKEASPQTSSIPTILRLDELLTHLT